MDLWGMEYVVGALGQPHRHIFGEEIRQQPCQLPRISRTVTSFSMIDVGNLLRSRSHADFRRLLVILQPTVTLDEKI